MVSPQSRMVLKMLCSVASSKSVMHTVLKWRRKRGVTCCRPPPRVRVRVRVKVRVRIKVRVMLMMNPAVG